MLKLMRQHVKVIMTTVILLFVASCFAGYGLYSRSGNRNSNGDSMQDYPVAEVNGNNIMRSQIENGLGKMAEQYNQKEINSADLPVLRKAVLDSLIIQDEVNKEIKNRKIDVNKDEINAEYVKIMDNYPTREEFKAYLERTGVTEKQVKDDIKSQMSQQKLLESVTSDISVTDKEANAFYDAAKTFLYKQPAGTSVNVATFKNNEAAKLAQKALADGANWDKIMAEHKNDIESSTPYAKPIVVTDQMMAQSPALAKIKDLAVNKVSQLINITDTNAMIAIKRGPAAEKVLPFSEVSADVRNAIKSQKGQEKQNEFYSTLLARANVQIKDATIFPAAAPETKSEDKK